MKFWRILFGAYLLIAFNTQAASIQFISIGVDGLTCSMCTRSVEMSLRKLDFVDSVVMDLENTEGKVYLKKDGSVDLRKVAKAVSNAGFSVRFMRISITFETPPMGNCFSVGPDSFQFISGSTIPPGITELVLVGDEFMPRKESAKYRKQMVIECPAQQVLYVRSL